MANGKCIGYTVTSVSPIALSVSGWMKLRLLKEFPEKVVASIMEEPVRENWQKHGACL